MHQAVDILVFSGYDRESSRQKLTWLSARRRVFFIEEPVSDPSAAPYWEKIAKAPNILICRPHSPIVPGGFHEAQLRYLQPLMNLLLVEEKIQDYLVWFCAPAALPLAARLTPRSVIYDRPEQHPGPAGEENLLLAWADLVFTSNASLEEDLRHRHRNIVVVEPNPDGMLLAAPARAMEEEVDRTVRANPAPKDAAPFPNSPPATVVIGAGLTGLTVAYHLGSRATLLEQNNRVGGRCRSIEDKGFTFDYSGHAALPPDSYARELCRLLLGENGRWHGGDEGPGFGYPLKGGCQALANGFLPRLQATLRLNARVKSVSPLHRAVTLEDGSKLLYQHLVSTMPLPLLVRAAGQEVPPAILEAAAGLRHLSVRRVNLGVGRENLTSEFWIHYHGEAVFHRIFAQGNASPHSNPPGGFGLTCEIDYSDTRPLPCEGRQLIDLCIADCRKVGIIGDDPVWTSNQLDLPYASVVDDHGRAGRVSQIREWFLERDVVTAGHHGEWECCHALHPFVSGRAAAETVASLQVG